MKKMFFYIFFINLFINCSYEIINENLEEQFSITELAEAVVEAQDFIQYGYKLSELDTLDFDSLKIIINKAMNEDKLINPNINPSNLVLALYKTYISPKNKSKSEIIKAYIEAIDKSYNNGYFRIDISGYKTLTKQQKKEKEEQEKL